MIEGQTVADAAAWIEQRGVAADSAVALRALVEAVTVERVTRAFASSLTLRRLGLAWNCTDEVTAAAGELRAELVVWSDYHQGGSALWPPGYYGP